MRGQQGLHDVLPVEAIRDEFVRTIESGAVVISSPTGSGKSTQVPRWCTGIGPVLVVEPRRVACRSLALRVAELENTSLGKSVGYSVRDDTRASAATQILFATPGIVLRKIAANGLQKFATIILDEFHERSLDVDLLLALLQTETNRLVVMSATIDGDRVAEHIGGRHLSAEGRTFPVDIEHRGGDALLPTRDALDTRVIQAVDKARALEGDILVFLPGKAEIASCAGALKRFTDCQIMPLHGGLSLGEQTKVFQPTHAKKVILATNVAETSITVPGVGVVIDSGLVRQTRYHDGRGFLTLVPVAMDSADQRAGRAGRTAPGTCFRLWSASAVLEASTRPEIFRESLTPLVLAAASCGSDTASLRFLDPPKPHALSAAVNDLNHMGALGEDGRLTTRGSELFGLPLDAHLGRLLVEAKLEGDDCLADMIDLVSAISVGRPVFVGKRTLQGENDENGIRTDGCDATATIRAIRFGKPDRDGLSAFVLREARQISQRLRSAFSLEKLKPTQVVNSRRLAETAIRADPRCAHVARRRKRGVMWSNGGTEIALSRDSAVNADKADAIIVVDSRALGFGGRDVKIVATCAIPVRRKWLAKAGLGDENIGSAVLHRNRVTASIQRVYAGQVIEEREEVPHGKLARLAIADLYLRGKIFPAALTKTQDRLEAGALAGCLIDAGALSIDYTPETESVSDWIMERLEQLGVETGGDLALLSEEDFTANALPNELETRLNTDFPRRLTAGDVDYRVEYNLGRREVVLHVIPKRRGRRPELPQLTYLPSFRGFRIKVQYRNVVRMLRETG
jgi:ATP-dependent helicase HrpB